MDGFTLVDGAVAAIILVSAILAFSRGFVREVLSIAGWVFAAVVAYAFTPQVRPLVREIPVVGELLENCELSVIAAFFAVFAVALIVVSVFTPLLSSLVQKSALGGFDQGLGFLFGIIRGAVLVAVAFVLYERVFIGEQRIEIIDQSRSSAIFSDSKDVIAKQIPDRMPNWVEKSYKKLTSECVGDADKIDQSGTSGT